MRSVLLMALALLSFGFSVNAATGDIHLVCDVTETRPGPSGLRLYPGNVVAMKLDPLTPYVSQIRLGRYTLPNRDDLVRIADSEATLTFEIVEANQQSRLVFVMEKTAQTAIIESVAQSRKTIAALQCQRSTEDEVSRILSIRR